MSRFGTLAAIVVVALALAPGCRSEMLSADLGRADGSSADLAAADLAGCDLSKTRKAGTSASVAVGDYCDALDFCVADQAAADRVKRYAPDFQCDVPQAPTCPYHCQWNGARQIDATKLAEICVATRLDPINTITCMIYL